MGPNPEHGGPFSRSPCPGPKMCSPKPLSGEATITGTSGLLLDIIFEEVLENPLAHVFAVHSLRTWDSESFRLRAQKHRKLVVFLYLPLSNNNTDKPTHKKKKNRPSPRSEATPVTPLGRSSWLWNCLISAARSALSSAPSAASYVCESADGRWDVFLYGHVKIYTYDRCIGFFIEPKKQRL